MYDKRFFLLLGTFALGAFLASCSMTKDALVPDDAVDISPRVSLKLENMGASTTLSPKNCVVYSGTPGGSDWDWGAFDVTGDDLCSKHGIK